MAIIKLAASVTQADISSAGTLIDAGGNIVSTAAEATYIVVLEQGKPAIMLIASAPTLSQIEQDLQIARRIEALPAVATEADLLTLTFGTAVDSGQVGPGDEVPVGSGKDTRWFKFSGASQADIADSEMWKPVNPVVPVAGGRYAGSSGTMAGAPTTLQNDGVTALAPKDAFFLTANDVGTGTADAPEFPRGWYVRNAANDGWQQDALDPSGTGTRFREVLTIISRNTVNPLADTPIGVVEFLVNGVESPTGAVTNSGKTVTIDPVKLKYNIDPKVDEVVAKYDK